MEIKHCKPAADKSLNAPQTLVLNWSPPSVPGGKPSAIWINVSTNSVARAAEEIRQYHPVGIAA